MKVEVKVLKNYNDIQLKATMTSGAVIEMPRKRAEELKEKGLVEIIKTIEEATIEEEVETAIEKPKKKKK